MTTILPGASDRSPSVMSGTAHAVIPGAPHLRVAVDEPMSRHTTWRIGGPADALIRVATTDDVIAASSWAREQGLPIAVIGAGSNLLVDDAGVRGAVLVARTPGERAEHLLDWRDEGDAIAVEVGAQAPLSWFGRYCSDRGWGGMAWAVGLPGTIGGATVNNAGAHGAEQKDHLVRVQVLTGDGQIEWHDVDWLRPAYRYTTLKATPPPRPFIVLASAFQLPREDPERLRIAADAHATYRRTTQPSGRCAGSTFTNPAGDYAGRLLEAAGLKGFAVGGVSFSQIHSNFIVNDGTGTAAQVRELIAIAQQTVAERFGIHLEPEIEELGG